ncbi:hypothetical protein NE237_011936 [Protea cynaroides]|uniref:Uncharacterized protein n=1 Tax=Protea cynaroides TaxID=273540 RepID=A0A9Q0GWL1_9MAGN|nr:hypothetical protein NE237_011936 [Protea cynaroides]
MVNVRLNIFMEESHIEGDYDSEEIIFTAASVAAMALGDLYRAKMREKGRAKESHDVPRDRKRAKMTLVLRTYCNEGENQSFPIVECSFHSGFSGDHCRLRGFLVGLSLVSKRIRVLSRDILSCM